MTDKRNEEEKESDRRFKAKLEQINGTWSDKISKASSLPSRAKLDELSKTGTETGFCYTVRNCIGCASFQKASTIRKTRLR